MKNNKIGYIRVSSYYQNISRQLDGIYLDKMFIDKASGKNIYKPELENLKQF